jgi:SAM-dependent methyltransferase
LPEINTTIFYPDDGNEATFLVEERSWWYRHRNRIICTLYKKYQHTSADVFADIGGGNGVVAKALQEAGVDVCMVEPYETGAKNAKQRGVKRVMNASIETIPGEFMVQAAGLFDVLEHLPDDAKAIEQIAAHLTPGGIFIATVPAFNFLFSENDKRIGHFRRYTKRELVDLLRGLGFTIEYCSYFFSLLFLPMWFVRKVLPQKSRDHKKSRVAEHTAGSKWLNQCLFFLLTFEHVLIKANIQLPIGTSCIIVARKHHT